MTRIVTGPGLAVALLVVVGVGCWWVDLPPVPLLLAAYVAWLSQLRRDLPTPVAACGAVIAPLAIYLVALLVAPALTDGPLRAEVALGILALPCAVALLPMTRRGVRRRTRPWGRPRPVWLAAGVGGSAFLAAVTAAARADRFGGYAWAASGDSRLHTLFARQSIAEGGLARTTVEFQPDFQEALFGLLGDTHGRAALGPGALVEHDLRVLAVATGFLVVAWSLLTVASLAALRPHGQSPSATVLGVASLLPVTGLGLGVLLRDGFLPTLVVVVVATTTMALLTWAHQQDPSDPGVDAAVLVSAAALPVLAFTWTPAFGIVALGCVPTWLKALSAGRVRTRTLRLVGMLIGGGLGSAYCLYMLGRSERYIAIAGSIAPPNPLVTLAVAAVVVAIASTGVSGLPGRAFVPWSAGTLAAVGVVIYAVTEQPPGLPWNYFPAKVAWTWVLVCLPFLLLPFTRAAHSDDSAGADRARLTRWGPVVALLVIVGISPVPSPVLPTSTQWVNATDRPLDSVGDWRYPSADALRLAVDLVDRPDRYVVFRVDGFNDVLTNFWLSARDPVEGYFTEDEFITWQYGGSHENFNRLCDLLELQPERVVVVTHSAAAGEVRAACGIGTRTEILTRTG
jgi:hypothetical protein